MTSTSPHPQPSDGPPPALVVIDDDASTRAIVAGALRRRFGADYDVVEASGAREADTALRRLHDAGADVAIIAANVAVEGDGSRVLAQTRDRFPTARRLVMSQLGNNWVLPSISHATALGMVDHWEYLPGNERDEYFLSSIATILVDWAHEHGRGESRLTIVGEPGDPDFKVVTDVLQRWQPEPIVVLKAGTPEADAFMNARGITGPLPVVAMADGRVVTHASIAALSDAIGSAADPSSTYDVVVLGLGPAGFSAAVNAASEGLRTLIINDTFSQASSSPLVRNYLGFPAGITGAELMRRAWAQAMMFGAAARIGRTATALRREDGRNVVSLDDGSEVRTDVVLLAIGADIRRLGVERVDRLVGRGVFYGFGALEAKAMTGGDAAVIGGGNSAVQAALHVARYARSVRLIVRDDSLAASASEYLVTQLDGTPNVRLLLDSEVVDASDDRRLRTITIRNRRTGDASVTDVTGLFVMIGAVPRTDWLPEAIARDERGFILTGDDGPRIDRPDEFRLPFETTMPGVFALGDVRAGSVKRIAAAVGEGSAAVQQVHRYLARLASAQAAARERDLGERPASPTMHPEIAAAAHR